MVLVILTLTQGDPCSNDAVSSGKKKKKKKDKHRHKKHRAPSPQVNTYTYMYTNKTKIFSNARPRGVRGVSLYLGGEKLRAVHEHILNLHGQGRKNIFRPCFTQVIKSHLQMFTLLILYVQRYCCQCTACIPYNVFFVPCYR